MLLNMRKELTKEINDILPDVFQLRQDLHANPELGNFEKETTSCICRFLSERGVSARLFQDMTGAIVNIDVARDCTVAFRADIDALPIHENTGVTYTSKNPGIMHACGHDVHAAVAAGLAVILHRLRDILPCNVRIIFQPAEECNPCGGAKKMIEKGVLEGIKFIIGLHVWPEIKEGNIGVRPGYLMAASDRLSLTVIGEKSHAAEPHKGCDAIAAGIQIIETIRKIPIHEVDPFEPSVISIGEFNSHGRYNVISNYVGIGGTIRTYSACTRELIHERIREAVQAIAKITRVTCDLDLEKGYNTVFNDYALCEAFTRSAQKTLGKRAVELNVPRSMIGEDFSFYGDHIPSLFFFLGAGSKYPLHSDKFIAHEMSMLTALRVLGEFFLSISMEDRFCN